MGFTKRGSVVDKISYGITLESNRHVEPFLGGGDADSGSSVHDMAITPPPWRPAGPPLAPWRGESDQTDVAVVLAERGEEELVADEKEEECWRVRVQSLWAKDDEV